MGLHFQLESLKALLFIIVFICGLMAFLFHFSPSDGPKRPMDKKLRRQIANSNERRRMQSINQGFHQLRLLMPHLQGEKLSKVGHTLKCSTNPDSVVEVFWAEWHLSVLIVGILIVGVLYQFSHLNLHTHTLHFHRPLYCSMQENTSIDLVRRETGSSSRTPL